ncbi:MAG: hypothetical protein KQA40_00190 [Candidatus Aenigmarchaeota archaeon]|nr:hypothetical protein [Candidatus Aenigmarchaeota archaeon]
MEKHIFEIQVDDKKYEVVNIFLEGREYLIKGENSFYIALNEMLNYNTKPLTIDEIIKLRLKTYSRDFDFNKLTIDTGIFYKKEEENIVLFKSKDEDSYKKIINNKFNEIQEKEIKRIMNIKINDLLDMINKQFSKKEALNNKIWRSLVSKRDLKKYAILLFDKQKDNRKKMGIGHSEPLENENIKAGYLTLLRSFDGTGDISFNEFSFKKPYSIMIGEII